MPSILCTGWILAYVSGSFVMIRMLISIGRLGRGRLALGLGLMDEANSIPVGTLKVKSIQNKDGVVNVPTYETFRFELAYIKLLSSI